MNQLAVDGFPARFLVLAEATLPRGTLKPKAEEAFKAFFRPPTARPAMSPEAIADWQYGHQLAAQTCFAQGVLAAFRETFPECPYRANTSAYVAWQKGRALQDAQALDF